MDKMGKFVLLVRKLGEDLIRRGGMICRECYEDYGGEISKKSAIGKRSKCIICEEIGYNLSTDDLHFDFLYQDNKTT